MQFVPDSRGARMKTQFSRVTRRLRSPFAREFTWLSVGNQAAGLLSMTAMVVLVRAAPVAQVGQVVFAQATAALVMTFVDLRFEDAAQHYYPRLAVRSPAIAASLFWRLVRWDALFGLSVVIVALGSWAVGFLPESPVARPSFFALALVAAGIASAVGTLNAGFAVTGGLTSLGRVSLVLSTANAVFAMAGAILLGGLGFLIGNLAGSLLQVAVLCALCRQRLAYVNVSPRASALPPGFGRFLLSSSVSTSIVFGSESGVLAIAGIGGGPTLVALLRVAQAPGRLLQSMFSPLAVQAFPRLSNMAAESNQDGMIRWTTRTTKVVLGVGCLVVVAGALLMQPAIEIMFGAEYTRATHAAILLLLAGLLKAAMSWAKVLPLAVGRPTLRLVVMLAESAVTLAGTVLIIKSTADAPTAAMAIAALSVLVSVVLLFFWLAMSRWRGLLRSPMSPPNSPAETDARIQPMGMEDRDG